MAVHRGHAVTRNAQHVVVGASQTTPAGRKGGGHAKRRPAKLAWREAVEDMPLTISVVIPTRNLPDSHVRRCVAALPEDVEAVLVLTDAGHTDVSWLAGRPHTKVAQDFAPFVFARASNLGARAASGEALLFLNDDCFFRDPSDVHALCSALNDPSCGAVAPLATYAGNPDMRGQSATGEVRRTFRPLNGFCVALRRGTFYGVGGWDERYRGYGTDDDDLATQLMQRHYRLRVNGAVCVDHVGHASFGRDWEHIHSEIEKWGFPREGLASRFTDPEVSVVIPCYNAEEWIAECVASCFAQESAPSLEVVVVNDGSTDGSLEVLRALKARYGESLIVMTQPNAGPSAARNKGVRRSLGQTIVFQDADDLMPPTRVRDSVAALADLDLVYGQCWYFEPGQPVESGYLIEGIVSPHPDLIAQGNGFRIGASAARRSLFEEHGVWLDEAMAGAEDWELMVHAVAKGLRVAAHGVGAAQAHFAAGKQGDVPVMLWRRMVKGSLRWRVDYEQLRAHGCRKHARFFGYVQEHGALPPRGEDWTGGIS